MIKKFDLYKHNYFIFEELFSEEFSAVKAHKTIQDFLFRTYNRNEIDNKIIYISLQNIEENLTSMFKDDHKDYDNLFNITRSEAYQRINILQQYLHDNGVYYNIFNIYFHQEFDEYILDFEVESIYFYIYDNKKTKIRRKYESFKQRFYKRYGLRNPANWI